MYKFYNLSNIYNALKNLNTFSEGRMSNVWDFYILNFLQTTFEKKKNLYRFFKQPIFLILPTYPYYQIVDNREIK